MGDLKDGELGELRLGRGQLYKGESAVLVYTRIMVVASQHHDHVGFTDRFHQFIPVGHGVMAKVGEDHHRFFPGQPGQLFLEVGQGLLG